MAAQFFLVQPEFEFGISNPNPVTRVQRHGSDPLPIDASAERATLILQEPTPLSIADDGVATRDTGRGER
jgi:hypothetical protein